jgi:RluA family pseudouridine synthase
MREFPVSPDEAGNRLDRFLKKLLPGAPLSLVYKLGRTNRVKVDGKRKDDSYRLSEGETVRVFLTDAEFEEFGRKETARTDENVFREMKFRLTPERILFEDAELLAVAKPAGLNVHPGDHKTAENSLIEAALDYLGGRFDSLLFRPSLVHRIDRDTSGVVLIAKTKRALDRMLSLLQGGKIEKAYLAVTVGTPAPETGTVRKKLLRAEGATKRSEKVVVDPSGQPAVTHYAVRKKGIHGKYALLECRIETGRTHQIRVHLASLGTPVLGDKSYGDASENSFARRNFDIHRQLLHASKLAFAHPVTGKLLTVEAPMEKDMEKLLNA